MNIGRQSKEPATSRTGGAHITRRVNSSGPRARRRAAQTPQAASANSTGNATLPVALLKKASGSHQAGLISQSNFPAEIAACPAVIGAYKAGARIAMPARIAIAAMSTVRDRLL